MLGDDAFSATHVALGEEALPVCERLGIAKALDAGKFALNFTVIPKPALPIGTARRRSLPSS